MSRGWFYLPVTRERHQTSHPTHPVLAGWPERSPSDPAIAPATPLGPETPLQQLWTGVSSFWHRWVAWHQLQLDRLTLPIDPTATHSQQTSLKATSASLSARVPVRAWSPDLVYPTAASEVTGVRPQDESHHPLSTHLQSTSLTTGQSGGAPGGDLWQAVGLLTAALDDPDTDHERILTQLVALLDQGGAYTRCLFYLRQWIDAQPENPQLHEKMGDLLLKMDDLEGALESYRSAVLFGKTPTWTSAIARRIGLLLYEKKQDLNGAVKCLKMGLDLDPDNPELLSTLGDMYFEQGDYRAALRIYTDLLAYEPDNADLHTYLGYLHWQLDDNDQAIDAYQRALALEPNNPVALNNLGVIHLDTFQSVDHAYKHFQQACQLKPSYVMAHFNRGRSLEQLGQWQQARQAYQVAHRLNEQAEELPSQEILTRLVQINERLSH